jgi:hypothetical protein
MPAMISAFHPPLPGFPRRGSALDRPQHLSIRQRCWWGGHRWDYRMSTQRVIIEFRQCLRCDEVEVLVGCAG